MDSNNQNNFYKDIEPNKKSSIFKNRKSKYIFITVIIVIAAIGVFYWLGNEDDYDYKILPDEQVASTKTPAQTKKAENDTKTPQETSAPVQEIKTIDDYEVQKMTVKSSGSCSALAPEDWAIVSDQYGRGVDLYNADQSEGAGWFIAPIMYDLYGEPDQAITTMMQQLGNQGYTFTNKGQEIDGGFIMREFSATNNGRPIKGIGLYKKYPVDDYGYVLSYYQGATTTDKWESRGGIATSVAVSIRCTAQITPSPDDGFSSSSSSSISDSSDKSSLIDSWSEQAILGQETVHSPSTGETFSVDINSYSDTGLQGQDPGYYRTIDSVGTVERLESGFGDY